jgi:hypothetical protein
MEPYRVSKTQQRSQLMKRLLLLPLLALLALGVMGCERDADVALRNLSKAADMFEITRRVVFYNGITNDYILSIEGRCAVHIETEKVTVTCKIAPDAFKKHYLVRSDNVTMFAEQLDTSGS